MATPEGLNTWWTKKSSGVPGLANEYVLDFGPGYQWTAVVTACVIGRAMEWQLRCNDPDWQDTYVGFALEEKDGGTWVRFYHRGWPEPNHHFRTSSYCWAMYLRLLKQNLEAGLFVVYEKRLDV
jgi:hypothetical protein